MQPVNTSRNPFQLHNSGTQYRTLLQLFHIDLFLLCCLLALIAFGFVILYSAAGQNLRVLTQEIAHISAAMLVLFLLAQLPPHFYQRIAPGLFAISIFLLGCVLIIGHIGMGAQRWINLGLFRFQPSEIMRIALPMMLAAYFARRDLPPSLRDILICSIIIVIPFFLTLKQPDLGTALVLLMGGGCVLLLAGLKWRYMISAIIGVVGLAPILWHHMHDYQRQRVLTFLNPARDPRGNGYHIIQSKIAIGSGGFFGKGWLHGTQSHLHFLPAHATDFIFAVCGEEFGFIGSLFLITIYLLIIARTFMIAYNAQDTFTRLLAGSLSLMFFFSVFINVGMVTGILPVVGLPLPLISYGGTSMLMTLASFGILMSINGHKKLLSK